MFCELSLRNSILIEDLVVANPVNKPRIYYGNGKFTNIFNPYPANVENIVSCYQY